jgi:sialate O-acetylesterase
MPSKQSLSAGGRFGQFSSVCWFFGKQVYEGLNKQVPIGLISDNWGGTPVESWSTAASLNSCGEDNKPGSAPGSLYNAMIHPFTVGPMAVTGFTWYQGEANTRAGEVEEYACRFPAMISAWREAFKVPKAYFGFIQLSTWCGALIPEMRATQIQAFEKLDNIGYATNADHGAGCNIHPPPKQYCGYRLGDSALKIVYNFSKAWQSPNMTSQTFAASPPSATITVDSVSAVGLSADTRPFNEGQVNCSLPQAGCAWASLKLADGTWANATIAVSDDKQGITFTVPNLARLSAAAQAGPPTASAYGWGANPMMTVYDKGTDLPLLPWNSSFVPY